MEVAESSVCVSGAEIEREEMVCSAWGRRREREGEIVSVLDEDTAMSVCGTSVDVPS